MSETDNIIDKLQETTQSFSSAAKETVSAMFGAEADIVEEWKVVDRLSGHFDRIITMGSGNDDYSALILVAMKHETLATLLDEEDVDLEYASDALGEFVNSYCGILSDDEAFTEAFGKQIQAVPLLYTDGCPFLPFLTGVEGYLELEGEQIYVGYTIKKHRIRTK